MDRNYFIYAVEYRFGGLVPVVFEVQELTTHPHSGEILGAFGIGYSSEAPTGECVAAPAYLLACPIDADLAETLIHYLRQRNGSFVPRRLVAQMPRLEMSAVERRRAAVM